MASFHGHITASSALGLAVGAFGSWHLHYDWGVVFFAAALTTIGGMLPDLDSESGIPVREMFGLAGVLAPLLLAERVRQLGYRSEELLVLLGATYLLVRYGVAAIFKHFTVHRGMFHSIPAMLIAGMVVFLMHRSDHVMGAEELQKRFYLAAGTMLGFLSHLILDELFAVDLMGFVPKLNHFAGSALKFTSASWPATLVTYTILLALGYMTWTSIGSATGR